MNHDCERAREMMVWLADGESPEAWLEMHLESCAECRGALAGFLRIDGALKVWGERMDQRPAASPLPISRGPIRIPWIPAAAVAVATALGLMLMIHYARTSATQLTVMHATSAFRAIPYIAPLDPSENTEIIELNVRVASLIAMGYRVAADPDAIVQAEVLVGEDGRAYAVRVLGNIDLNGPGD